MKEKYFTRGQLFHESCFTIFRATLHLVGQHEILVIENIGNPETVCCASDFVSPTTAPDGIGRFPL